MQYALARFDHLETPHLRLAEDYVAMAVSMLMSQHTSMCLELSGPTVSGLNVLNSDSYGASHSVSQLFSVLVDRVLERNMRVVVVLSLDTMSP